MTVTPIRPTQVLNGPPGRRPSPVTQLSLISMPWPPVDSPYLALSTLGAYAQAADPDRRVLQEHLYLHWFRLLIDEFGDGAAELYNTVAERGAYTALGDFIFAHRLFPGSEDNLAAFDEICRVKGFKLPPLPVLRDLADRFVARHATRLAETLAPGTLVGVSTTFTQTVPGLALCAELKRLRPDLRTVMGGGNMNADRGRVLLRAVGALDGVVYGEGEQTLVRVLRTYDGQTDPASVSGLVTRVNEAVRPGPVGFIPLDDNPPPAMRDYFDQFSATELDAELEPKLAFEIGRGCWWGEKHHCTFCGLNGEGMPFRRKTRPDVADQILALVETYQVLDVIFADNILHPADIEAVFARLPEDLDLRMHLEVKANLRRDAIASLRRHGVWHMQPGIESLARRPLDLMRKGIDPWQNVRFLRDAEALGVTTSWNILTGFPGETVDDYTEMIEQLPHLTHLQPPGSVGVLGLVRYSPLFNDPALGIRSKRPVAGNFLTFAGLSHDDVEIMSEVFESDDEPESGPVVADLLRPLVDRWRREHSSTFLVEIDNGARVRIQRRRSGAATELHLTEDWATGLWRVLRPGRTATGLEQHYRSMPDATARLARELTEELLHEHNVLYRDAGCLITLPTSYEDHVPYRLVPDESEA